MPPSTMDQDCVKQLRQVIYYNLDLNQLDNALFLVNRLLAFEPRTADSEYLAALCNLRLRRDKVAYEYSKVHGAKGNRPHLGCAYVFAQACLNTGKHREGINALDRVRNQWKSRSNWGKHTETGRQPLPDAPAVLFLLGQLHRGDGDASKACEHFQECLKLNPFMWEAFSALCALGIVPRTSKVFTLSQDFLSAMDGEKSGTQDESVRNLATSLVNSDPFMVSTTKDSNDARNGMGKSTLLEKLNAAAMNATAPTITMMSDGFETPSNDHDNTIAMSKDSLLSLHGDEYRNPPHAPLRKTTSALGMGSSDTDTVATQHSLSSMNAPLPKMRKRTRPNDESESLKIGGPITDKKRTASGHTANASSSVNVQVSAHRAAATTVTTRKSNRIQQLATSFPAGNNGPSSATGPIPREVQKPRMMGMNGKGNKSTVGKEVSGNRKPIPMDALKPREARMHLSSSAAPQLAPSKQVVVHSERKTELQSVQQLLELFRSLASAHSLLSQYRCQEAITEFNNLPLAQRETPWVLSQIGKAYLELASWPEAAKYYSKVRSLAPAQIEDLEHYSTVLWHLKQDVELSFLAHEIMDIEDTSAQAWCVIGNALSLKRDHENALKCFQRASQLDPNLAYTYTLQGHEHVANEDYDKALEAYRSGIAVDKRHYNAWYGLGTVFEKQGKYDVAESHYRVALSIHPTNAVLVVCVGWMMEKMKKLPVALAFYNKASELAPKSSLARYKKARALTAMGKTKEALDELLILKDIVPEEANVHFMLGKVYKGLRDRAKAVKHFTSALNLDPKASMYIKEAMEQLEDSCFDDEEDEDELMMT